MLIFFSLSFWYGLGYVIGLTGLSYFAAHTAFMQSNGISSLVLAIIFGIILGNLWHPPASWKQGIQFAAKHLLRIAIMLYGFRISFQQIASVGLQAICIDIFIVASTLLLGYYLARKLFKLDSDLSLLISAGAAICGAAAVLAVEDILKSDPYKATIAIATVVLFGTLSMFLYPALQHAGILGLTDYQFGIFTGASIHEVAQVVVAGTNVSDEAGKLAVIVKMTRVLLLVPVLFLIAVWNRSTTHKKRLFIPWFAVGFIVVIAFHSLHLVANDTVNAINQIDMVLLTMAMGAIGLETKFSKIQQVGMKPLYLAFCLFIWLLISAWSLVNI